MIEYLAIVLNIIRAFQGARLRGCTKEVSSKVFARIEIETQSGPAVITIEFPNNPRFADLQEIINRLCKE